MSARVTEPDGISFETKYMEMANRFEGNGPIPGNDIEAALLLEAARDSRLKDLLARRIHAANAEIDDLTDVEDLVFTGEVR
jgi:hypothetical protein